MKMVDDLEVVLTDIKFITREFNKQLSDLLQRCNEKNIHPEFMVLTCMNILLTGLIKVRGETLAHEMIEETFHATVKDCVRNL